LLRTVSRVSPHLAVRLSSSRLAQRIAGTGVVRARRLGTPMTLQLGDNVQRTLYLAGTYEPSFLSFLRSELRADDVYVDVGGHIGIDAIVASRCVGAAGRVYVFEPGPDTARQLRAVTGENVVVVESALGDRVGTASLRANAEFGWRDASTRSVTGDGPTVAEVPITTFDAWAAETNPARMDIVKIDIEGSEAAALRGMRRALQTLRPRAIVVELLGESRDSESLLMELGYRRSNEQVGQNVVYRTKAPAVRR
jgi:FkbM family methyltransferase